MQRSEMVNFRASPDLVAALSQKADSEGITMSELVRRAVEAQVSTPTAKVEALDPFAVLEAAATGSLDAQRAIADRAFALALDSDTDRDPETVLTEGLVFARLAAAHGDISDQGRAINMLNLLAGYLGEEAAEEQIGEAVARISLIADAGVELADILLPDLAASISSDAMAQAKCFRSRITDRIGVIT